MTTLALVPERRDSLGRRIGRNWWREYNVGLFRDAHDAWEQRRESDYPAWGAAGAAHSDVACHQLEDADYRELFPEPTLKECLLGNKGMRGDDPQV